MRAVRPAAFLVVGSFASLAAAAPVARLSVTPTAGSPPLPVSFQTDGSTVDGTLAEHILFLGNGGALQFGNVEDKTGYAYELPGYYTPQTWLRQSDGGFAGSSPLPIVVTRTRDGRSPPAVTMTAAPARDDMGFTFSSTVTPATNDAVVAQRWDFGDGASSGAAMTQHRYARAGVYQPSLTVATRNGMVAFARQIIVAGGSLGPSLLVAAMPADAVPLTPVTVTAWMEGAPAGAKAVRAEVVWPDLDDAAPAVTPTAAGMTVTSSHSFDTPGYYDVPISLLLDGQTAPLTATAHVMVARPDGAPPSPALLAAPSSRAMAGVAYELNGDGATSRALLVAGPGPFAFGVAAPSPANFHVDDAGNVAWTPTRLQVGRQRVAVRITDADGRELVRDWVVDVAGTHGGCAFAGAGTPSAMPWLLLLGLLMSRVRYGWIVRQSPKQGTNSCAPPASVRGSSTAPPT